MKEENPKINCTFCNLTDLSNSSSIQVTTLQLPSKKFVHVTNSTNLVNFPSMVGGVGGVIEASRTRDVVLSVVLVGHGLSWSVIVHPYLEKQAGLALTLTSSVTLDIIHSIIK